MSYILLFLHLVGLMFGAAGGIGSAILMRRAIALPPEQAQVLRGLGPLLAHVSGAGLVVLWITGVIMVFTYGGIGSMPPMFWVKMIFVLSLTIIAGLIHMTYAQIRRTGNVALGKRLALLGPLSGASSFLAVLFAVLAFG